MSEEKVFHIGVMIGNVHTQHPMELIKGICEAAKTENVNISFFVGAQGNALSYWNKDQSDLYAYNYQFNSLYDYSLIAGLDALIISYGTLCIYLDKEDREIFASKYRSVPMVILEEYDEETEDSFIISDNYGGMYKIVDHLLTDHGYKKVLYLSGPKNNTDSNEREHAYIDAMKAHGLTISSDMVEYGDYSSHVEYLVERLLNNYPDAEAIVAANDEMALSVYKVCKKRGLVPGRDIAVTGYDDVDFAQRMDPPLTTANQDGLEMGYRSLKCAVSLCKGAKPVKIKLPARFMLRQSCGCKMQVEELELSGILEKIVSDSDKDWIEKAASKASVSSYQSIASDTVVEKGKEYFRQLINSILNLNKTKGGFDEKEISEKALYQIQKLCSKGGVENLDFSGFLRSFHQVIHFFMDWIDDPDILVQLGLILEVTDNYITSYIMLNNEDRISMLMNNSWKAPASIRYMIEKVEDEKAFYHLAIKNVINQGAKSAYLYLLEKPLECDRKEQFKCPDKLELAAEYTDNEIKVYEKNKRPIVTKEKGFASQFPSTSKHSYGVFLLFAKAYQYGIMLCEIDPDSIGLLYGSVLQISTAKAFMQVSEQENEAKRQLYNTLKELSEKNRVLSFVSSTDELTGLYNRRGFIEKAVAEVNDHQGMSAAVFFSDLDHLKQINDEFGHKDGDYALKNAAEIIKETFTEFRKEGTVCARIGGDEFVTFMILEKESDADEVQQRLKERCRIFNENSDKPYYVEFSTGCYSFVCSEDNSVTEITNEADKCLYESKKSRRPDVRK